MRNHSSILRWQRELIWAAMCMGFLRSGEFTASSRNSYNPSKHLSFSDISTDSHTAPTLLRLHLRYSKTDQFGEGVTIILAWNGSVICPVTALVNYLSIRGSLEEALFVNQDGFPFTKHQLTSSLENTLRAAGINPLYCKGHSYYWNKQECCPHQWCTYVRWLLILMM